MRTHYQHGPRGEAGFTRLEICFALVAVALLGAVALPGVTASGHDARSAACLNNLRLMARAAQVWADEHQGEVPWRTPVSQGGTLPQGNVKPANAWAEFSFMSNQLVTPRILSCPSDSEAGTANDFSTYIAATHRARATSYFLNLHGNYNGWRAVLFGDRNLSTTSIGSCPYGVAGADTIQYTAPVPTAWTNGVHAFSGNLALSDGSVLPSTSADLRTALGYSDEGGRVHLLRAR
jgi:type II secretory pathway pseudopilin PulG